VVGQVHLVADQLGDPRPGPGQQGQHPLGVSGQ
jgi:hypothetical protein